MAQSSESSCKAQSGQSVVPLVELYTSEGCSSCPPADRWLTQRFKDGGANYLAFHVDYWDDIGWPDRFGSPVFAQRQRVRVAAAGERTVYTPQVMVGSQVRTNWSRGNEFAQALSAARTPARAAMTLRLDPTPNGWRAAVGAAFVGESVPGAQLVVVRYVDAQTTQVRAGENRGETLRHDRVVRALSGPWPLGAVALSREIALAEESGPWGITAFVQDARGAILQSLDLNASACNRQ